MNLIIKKEKGYVKWFNDSKGFGFIISSENSNSEFFFHFSSINMVGFKTIKEGQMVLYNPVNTKKGKQALNINIINKKN